MNPHLLINWAGVNSGDDYLCELIVSQVADQDKISTIRMLSEKPVPAVSRRIGHADWYPLFSALNSLSDFARVCSEIKRADQILIGGGDVIRPEFISMLPLLLAVLFDKKIKLIGVGVISPKTYLWEFIYRIAMTSVSHALVRDARSGENLRQFSATHIEVAPDLVFAAANNVVFSRGEDCMRDAIVINLRSVTNREYLQHLNIESLDDDTLCSGLARAILEHQSMRTNRIVLFPMVDDATLDDGYLENESDLVILKKIRRLVMPHMRVDLIHHRPRSLEELSDIYRCAKVVIAMRLHAVIPALAWGIPVVTIPYASKVADLRDRFQHIQTISINDLLQGTVDQAAQAIQTAVDSQVNPHAARREGAKAIQSLSAALVRSSAESAYQSPLMLARNKFISTLLVAAFALKSGLNRLSAQSKKCREAM
jgi:polysaccharide pyruvyl transferase WcaK-like protein